MFHAALDTADHHIAASDGAPSPVPQTGPDRFDPTSLGEERDGSLYFQRCSWCRTASFRRLLCPVCASPDMVRERSDGIGVIRTVRAICGDPGTPRTLAIIEMREGFRACATIIAVPPEQVHTGNQVELAAEAGPPPRELLFRLRGTVRHGMR